MIKHFLTLFLIILVILFMDDAFSEEYSVLLATSDKSLTDEYDVLSIYGDLYSTKDKAGNIQTRLGPFSCETCANEALHEAQVAGHTLAKLVSHPDISNESRNNEMTSQRYISNTFDIQSLLDEKTLAKWNKLSPKQKSNISYFNGELLIKEGDKYIALDDYK